SKAVETLSSAPPRQAQHFAWISGPVRHCCHLVASITVSVLPAALLRCLGAKLLPLQRRLSRHRTVRRFPHQARRTPAGPARVSPVPGPFAPERGPSNHPDGLAFLYRSRRLRDFHAFFGNHDRITRSYCLSGRAAHSPAMAISGRDVIGITRGRRRFLVSTWERHGPRCHSRAVDCFCRYDVLGALRCACSTS